MCAVGLRYVGREDERDRFEKQRKKRNRSVSKLKGASALSIMAHHNEHNRHFHPSDAQQRWVLCSKVPLAALLFFGKFRDPKNFTCAHAPIIDILCLYKKVCTVGAVMQASRATIRQSYENHFSVNAIPKTCRRSNSVQTTKTGTVNFRESGTDR